MDRMQRFVNLLSVATADGRLTEREILFLSQRAHDWGLSDHQFAIAVNRSLEHPGKLQIPRRREERADLLRDMLRIMASDGKLLDVEKQLFAVVAARMKFGAAEIDAIIDELVGNEAREEAATARRRPKPQAAKPAPTAQSRAKPRVKTKTVATVKAKPTSPSSPPPKSAPKKSSSKKASRR